MSALQGLIFIAGLVVLVGIYAQWRWSQSRKTRAEEDHERVEPGWQDDEEWEADSAADVDEDWMTQMHAEERQAGGEAEAPPRLSPAGKSAAPTPPPALSPASRAQTRGEGIAAGRVLVFYIIARNEQGFAGTELSRAFRDLHLEAGERDIFYRYAEDGRQSVFCVANAIEPGNFDLTALDGLRTPGLTVFAVLPGPWSARHILTAMHRAALSLADRLGGEVLDRRRAPLTAMGFQALLDELPAED